jgi:methylated-DNA-protein-cysteine methyltransferase-like protein
MTAQRQFAEIFDVVRQIPSGKVMTYGQIGHEVNASPRVVGWAMANVEGDDIPWHRVVGADGYLKIGRRSQELMAFQRKLLELENVTFRENGTVDLSLHSDLLL